MGVERIARPFSPALARSIWHGANAWTTRSIGSAR
jgi:hypothetical protein